MNENVNIKYIFILIVAILLTYLSVYFTMNYGENVQQSIPTDYTLPDIGHYLLPDFSKYEKTVDIFPVVAILSLIYLDKFKHANQFIYILAIILILRSISVSLTILPCSNKNAYEVQNNSKIPYLNGGCHDKMFSGHTAILILCTIFILYHKLVPQKYFSIVIIFTIIGILAIIATRSHYTVDVFIAIIITFLTFHYYYF